MEKKKPLILIADDNELDRSFLCDILTDEYRVLEATDGQLAQMVLEKEREKISLVLLDAVMPEKDGFQVLEWMGAEGLIRDIPVILILAEGSSELLGRGYALGVADCIGWPFHAAEVKHRVANSLLLYSKKQYLQRLVTGQMKAREQGNVRLVNMLSGIVEFRNNESETHVLQIRVIVRLLLEELARRYPHYGVKNAEIAVMSNAAALHDIGKILIPDRILNKPGKLTPEEFAVIKTHTICGAEMLKKANESRDRNLLQYGYAICRWHHERWDGSGYPDGRSGMEIPLCAQVVGLADVYDALVSERVYKPPFKHEEAVRMITGGDCGAFNPDLVDCFMNIEKSIKKRLEAETEELSCFSDDPAELSQRTEELREHEEVSSRSLELLERERKKYLYLAALADELILEYDARADQLSISEKGSKELGLPMVIKHLGRSPEQITVMSREDLMQIYHAVQDLTPESPLLQRQLLFTCQGGDPQWYELTLRGMWDNARTEEFSGFVGKAVNIHEKKLENSRLREMAEKDPVSGLYNRTGARRRIEELLAQGEDVSSALFFLDLDNFKTVNDVYGHLFGDQVLKFVGNTLRRNIRTGDVAARVGGDEFVLCLYKSGNKEQVARLADRICTALNTVYQGCNISSSIGVSLYPEDGRSYRTLLKKADAAMYEAKRSGKSLWAFYRERPDGSVSAKEENPS